MSSQKEFEVDTKEVDAVCAQFLESDQFKMLSIAPTQLPGGKFIAPGLNVTNSPDSDISIIRFSGPNQEKLETAFEMFMDSLNA